MEVRITIERDSEEEEAQQLEEANADDDLPPPELIPEHYVLKRPLRTKLPKIQRNKSTWITLRLNGINPLASDNATKIPFELHEDQVAIIRSVQIDRLAAPVDDFAIVTLKYYKEEWLDNGEKAPLDIADKMHEETLAILDHNNDRKVLEFALIRENFPIISLNGNIVVNVRVEYTDLSESEEKIESATKKKLQNDCAYQKLEKDLREKNGNESDKIDALLADLRKIENANQRIEALIPYITHAPDDETKELRMIWAGCWIIDPRTVLVNANRMHDVVDTLMSTVTWYFKYIGYKYSKKPADKSRLNELLDHYKINKRGWVHYVLA